MSPTEKLDQRLDQSRDPAPIPPHRRAQWGGRTPAPHWRQGPKFRGHPKEAPEYPPPHRLPAFGFDCRSPAHDRQRQPPCSARHIAFERACTCNEKRDLSAGGLHHCRRRDEIAGTLERHELAGEERNRHMGLDIQARADPSTGLRRRPGAEPLIVDAMGRVKQPPFGIGVMPPVGAGALTDIKGGIEEPEKRRISGSLAYPFEHPAGSVKVAVPTHQQRQAQPLGGEHRLQKGLEMPALNENSVEAALCQFRTNLRRVAAGKSAEPGLFRDIAQEDGLVPRQKINIPFKANPKSSIGLV